MMEMAMTSIGRHAPSLTRPVLDDRGRPIGQVVEPRTDRLTGRGAETVLLVRDRM
ncbi:MAG TPA: hypothetical protein VFS40_16535 [Gemmatimonadales bacterium]|nr:hypothetical protein [Gemmatimonadales bacterium]